MFVGSQGTPRPSLGMMSSKAIAAAVIAIVKVWQGAVTKNKTIPVKTPALSPGSPIPGSRPQARNMHRIDKFWQFHSFTLQLQEIGFKDDQGCMQLMAWTDKS